MVERFNRTLEEMLSAFVNDHQNDWDTYLPFLTMAYRSSKHESTKYSPNRLMLGREVNLPVDLIYGLPPNSIHVDESEYVRNLRQRFETAHKHAREKLRVSALRQKRDYDRFAVESSYQEGDLVWLLDPIKRKSRSLKLSKIWSGPYKINKRLSDVLYRIQKGVRSKSKIVHVDRLKPYVMSLQS